MLRFFHWFMAALFIFGAAVQYNDPDPVRWMMFYIMAAILASSAAFGRLRESLAFTFIGLASAWAVVILAALEPGSLNAADIFSSFSMKSQSVEEFREAGGLFIAAGYALAAVLAARRQRSHLT